MLAIFTTALFASALACSVWALVATVRPQAHRIGYILRHGAVPPVGMAPPLRSTVRGVPVRMRAATARPARAAA